MKNQRSWQKSTLVDHRVVALMRLVVLPASFCPVGRLTGENEAKDEAGEAKNAGWHIESAFDAADRQAAMTHLRLTHDEAFGSVRQALRDRRARRGSRLPRT